MCHDSCEFPLSSCQISSVTVVPAAPSVIYSSSKQSEAREAQREQVTYLVRWSSGVSIVAQQAMSYLRVGAGHRVGIYK